MKTNQYENYTQEEINLSELIKRLESQELDKEIEERMSKINIDGVDEEHLKTNNSISVKACDNGIEMTFEDFQETSETIEISLSRENVKRLLNGMIKVWDEAFPEKLLPNKKN